MTIQLPDDLERFVQKQVQSGRFASEAGAIAEAVRLLQQRQRQAGAEEDFERRLAQSGLLESIPSRRATPTSQRCFQPIRIEGEPLSETVIRERG